MLLENSVNKTNIEFGGRNPDVRNVIFVNGDQDPWHTLSILEDLNESTHAILIKGTNLQQNLLY